MMEGGGAAADMIDVPQRKDVRESDPWQRERTRPRARCEYQHPKLKLASVAQRHPTLPQVDLGSATPKMERNLLIVPELGRPQEQRLRRTILAEKFLR